jgi:hypothetical protein
MFYFLDESIVVASPLREALVSWAYRPSNRWQRDYLLSSITSGDPEVLRADGTIYL